MSRRTVAFVTLLASTALPAVAHALACGDTVGPGGTVKIAANLGPCAGPFALRVVGPVTLDLGNSTITCKRGSGLELSGRTAKVKGGRIVGCHTGIVFTSGSNHRVEGTSVFESALLGLHLQENSDRGRITSVRLEDGQTGVQIDGGSDRHHLESVVVVGAAFAGFIVDGSRNKLEGTSASASRIGFLVEGSKNTLLRNDAVNLTEVGYRIGGAGHALTLNDARNIGGGSATDRDDGFHLRGARDVTLLRNRATLDDGAGFRIERSRNVLVDGGRSELSGGDGIVVSESSQIEMRGVEVRDNGGHGIHVGAGVDRVRVRDNVADGHPAPADDLHDDTTDCAGTLWQTNAFTRGFPACVQ